MLVRVIEHQINERDKQYWNICEKVEVIEVNEYSLLGKLLSRHYICTFHIELGMPYSNVIYREYIQEMI